MMKKFWILPAALLALSLLACGTPAENDAALEATDEAAEEQIVVVATDEPVTAEPIPTAEPTPEPQVQRSNTSGKVLDGTERYQPVMVSIENASAARPQTGLMNADIVYEMLVESNITRFQALFSDDVPSYVGPVRSARYYCVDLQREWNGMYAHIGYTGLLGSYARSWSDCAIHISGGEWFYRIERDGVSNEHTMYLHLQNLIADEYGDHVPNRDERFQFDEGVTYEGAQRVSRVEVPFTEKTDIYYTYDEATGRMLRYQDGKEFMTRTPTEDGKYRSEQVAVTNLIIQHCVHGYVPASAQPGEDKGRRSIELTGSGACEYIVNGQLLTGTWERETLDDFTRYYLDDGTLVTLEAGNTWIEIVPGTAEIVVS